MRKSWLCGLFTAVLFSVAATAQDVGQSLSDFQHEHPDAGLFFGEDGRMARVWGTIFSTGATPLDSAEAFIGEHGPMLARGVGTLLPIAGEPGGPLVQTLLWQEDRNDFKFHLIRYGQSLEGIPVFRGSVILLMRNEVLNPLVLASVNLRDLQGAQIPDGAGQDDPSLDGRMRRRIDRAMGGASQIVDGPRFVIWAGFEGLMADPTLAIEVIAERGTVADPANYRKQLFLLDAATGQILFVENQISHVDISGNVSGMATDQIGADICGTESVQSLPYAEARVVGGNTTFADVDGDFTIPHAGNTQVTVESRLRGQWFEVFDTSIGGGTPTLTMNVTPPGPANFVHNQANTSETVRAGVNCYLHANICRDFVLSYDPTFPTIGAQQFFDVNVNLNSTCNAFYNGSSINFYRAGGGCANTGFDTVVYHEYGHHLVQVGSSGGQGAYGEGMADCIAVIITDDPILARGFQSNCAAGIRNANNNCQYQTSGCSSCGSEAHACGMLISGCVWSLRNQLLNSEPQTYRDILSEMTIASIRLHNYSAIDPRVTIDFITVDDDDGNSQNGSPHYQEINAAFTAHNMAAPPLALIGFDYPNGRPGVINPAGGTSFVVEVYAIGADPQPNTGVLHVDTGGGFVAFPMQETTDNVYNAVFPSSTCGTTVRYYVSAETVDGDVATDPPNAPTTSFSALSASGVSNVFADHFDSDMGWTVVNENLVDGPWDRGVPVNGNRGDPPADYDPTGQGFCFVTDNVPGNSDVDGGPTRLISPVLNMAGGGEKFVSYARWFTNDDGDIDRLDVHISNNGGTSWTLVESVPGDTAGGSWKTRSFKVSDFIAPTNNMRLRFSATDNPNDSVTEGGVDAFEVTAISCDGTTLTDVDVTFGTLVSGGLPEIQQSDNVRLRARSAFGFAANEPHLIVLNVDAVPTDTTPSTIDLSSEGRLTQAGGSARWRLRNWNTNAFVQVHTYAIGTTEAVETRIGIAAANFVRNDGVVEFEMRQSILASFSVTGFDSLTDHVTVNVN